MPSRRRIGALRHYVSIRERSTATDALNERVNTYSEVFRCWVGIRHGRQRINAESGAISTEDTLVMHTHYRDGFKPGGQQIAVDLRSGRQYRIDSPYDIDERRRWIEFLVVEQPVELPTNAGA